MFTVTEILIDLCFKLFVIEIVSVLCLKLAVTKTPLTRDQK